jgi:hypothetical protein
LFPDIAEGIRRRHANSGGPMSRTRKERIRSSLLGSDDGVIRCPRRISLCLRFDREIEFDREIDLGMLRDAVAAGVQYQKMQPDPGPVEYLFALLKGEGLNDPEELRERYILPPGKMICGPWTNTQDPLFVYDASSYDVLEQALMLGLCTAHIYDPTRPVLWTQTSLTRAVELFDPGGFYV